MPHRDPDFQDPDNSPFGETGFEDEFGKPDFWQRMSRIMEVLIYILCLGGAIKLFWPEVERQDELNSQLDSIQSVEAAKQEQVAALRQKYELLKGDREYLETVARDRLNLAREGEYVVRIGRDEIPKTGEESSE